MAAKRDEGVADKDRQGCRGQRKTRESGIRTRVWWTESDEGVGNRETRVWGTNKDEGVGTKRDDRV